MWNTKLGKPVPFDDPDTANLALEGMYDANGVLAYPAFQLIKNAMETYTAEWQEPISTVPAAKVREIANDLVSTRPHWRDSCYRRRHHALQAG